MPLGRMLQSPSRGVSDKVWSVISIGPHSVGSSEADLRLGSQNWATKVHFIISGI